MSRVREFHLAVGQAAPATPPLQPNPDLVRLRMRLIREEYEEVMHELGALVYEPTPERVVARYRLLLKELADLRYVLEGCAVSLGLPIEEAFREVHASNMTKLGADGEPILDAGGKVLKGPNYRPADMVRFVADIIDVTAIEEE